jgi:carbamoyl-phosphate synthase large subunit
MPPHSLPPEIIEELGRQASEMALALNVIGLMNVQFAVKGSVIYVIEVNPRASRTVPFVAKVLGQPIASIAAKIMAGKKLSDFNLATPKFEHIAVKEAVFPFGRFPGVDTILGPEMRSTGEVMGLDTNFATAFAKSQIGSGTVLPIEGTAFISVRNDDKSKIVPLAAELLELGFKILATSGTCKLLEDNGLSVTQVNKVLEGRPHIVDAMKDATVELVINTTEGEQSLADSKSIRRTALEMKIPYFTTIAAAEAAISGIKAVRAGPLDVRSLQDYTANIT